MIKSKFYGRSVRTKYVLDEWSGSIYPSHEVMERELIWEGDIERIFQSNQCAFVPALNKDVIIEEVMYNIEGGIVYYTNHITKEVIDEYSKIEEEKEKTIWHRILSGFRK